LGWRSRCCITTGCRSAFCVLRSDLG
jgi:hypothetical protein